MNAGLYARVLLGQRLCAPRDGQSEHRGFADDRCSAYDSLSTLLLDPVRRRTITTFRRQTMSPVYWLGVGSYPTPARAVVVFSRRPQQSTSSGRCGASLRATACQSFR